MIPMLSLRALALSAALFISPTGLSSPDVFTTQFRGAEKPLSEGGRWVTGKRGGIDWNDPVSALGKAFASVHSGATGRNRYDDSIAHLSDAYRRFAPDQFAEGTVYRASDYAPRGSKHEVELLLRFEITPHNARGYEILWGWDGDFAIVRWNGPSGNYTPLYGAHLEQLADGDVIRAEIRGGVIRVFRNGQLKAVSPHDATWSTGQPGVGFWPVDRTLPDRYGWKSFEAGDL